MAGLGFSESVGNIHQLIPLLRNGLYMATSTYRCAHLAVPIDVQLASVTAPKLLNFRKENLTKHVIDRVSNDQICGLATALIKERVNGQHMVIFCGWRAYPFGDAIEQLAAFLDVPIITSFDGKGEYAYYSVFFCLGICLILTFLLPSRYCKRRCNSFIRCW